MTAFTTTNTTISFSVNTGWLKPEHNEKVLQLNQAKDAAYAKIDRAHDKAKAKLDAEIDRLKAKLSVLDEERKHAKYVIDTQHYNAVTAARGKQKKGSK